MSIPIGVDRLLAKLAVHVGAPKQEVGGAYHATASFSAADLIGAYSPR